MIKQKRYAKASEIEVDIFKLRRDMFKMSKEAEKLECDVRENYKIGHERGSQRHIDQGDECRKAKEKILRRIKRIENNQIPRLKDTLAALKTETFQFMGEDKSVVKQ
jgi:hypothetical protein